MMADVGYDPAELAGTGRHMDPADLFVWTRFLDAARLVEELLARHLADECAMTLGEYEVMVRVDGAGGAMRLAVLADQCVSSRSRLTHTLDRLESRAWIERRPVVGDGRGIEAGLTTTGRDALATAAVGHAALIRDHLLDQWSEEEKAVIGPAMDRASGHIRSFRRPR